MEGVYFFLPAIFTDINGGTEYLCLIRDWVNGFKHLVTTSNSAF